MSGTDALIQHLKTGASTTCRAWYIKRRDGVVYGFTNHDEDIQFDGMVYKVAGGLTMSAVHKQSGLAVDNTEISGALTDEGLNSQDISAGRFDAAAVTIWIVNWNKTEERLILFRGTFGEIHVRDGAFRIELRGLADALNRQTARVYQPSCPAMLGDSECGFNLEQPGFKLEASIVARGPLGEYLIKTQPDYPERWFDNGRITVTTGRAKGLESAVQVDRETISGRALAMWMEFRLEPEVGDLVVIEAGCNKYPDTCRGKFANFLNFRGFPNIPSADWMMSYPISSQRNDGGSRQK